ncbi:unnamed protein product, partial [marine sediment metagenome]
GKISCWVTQKNLGETIDKLDVTSVNVEARD